MQFKKGDGWKAGFDDNTGTYTAESGGIGCYDLYEITKEIYDRLEDGMSDKDSYELIREGRHLYMAVDDRCGPPYTVILDSDYEKLCPWANVIKSGEVWSDELVDEAVEVFASEKKNREQRRRKRAEREKDKKESQNGGYHA